MTLHPQYITDKKGKKTGVLLSLKEYKVILENLDELEDIRLFDEAKKKDDGKPILMQDYIAKRKKQK
jgi:PHD/YefM family antitoxin component YafN of YafNO toxin-antitoxin module